MTSAERYDWADAAPEATLAVVAKALSTAEALLSRLGTVHARGQMTFAQALELQDTLYDDGTFDTRAVIQADRLPGDGGDWWATVEPNGFRASTVVTLSALAAESPAASVFWNVNADMSVLKLDQGHIVAQFDPLLDVHEVPEEGRDLPFGVEEPRAAALALLERWTGVFITQEWLRGTKATFIVETPA
ncbi:MAG: DUF6461 domain-containing protein [Solirubrobacteraceae bacterium]